jgi:hypothetical protein
MKWVPGVQRKSLHKVGCSFSSQQNHHLSYYINEKNTKFYEYLPLDGCAGVWFIDEGYCMVLIRVCMHVYDFSCFSLCFILSLPG